mmetsp:Transcript_10982/g.20717  ORF Transcript_10982/g.20717 Transcript_10982/m.20717 type:complete len:258 (-) Transcript_10982:695-1468(-)
MLFFFYFSKTVYQTTIFWGSEKGAFSDLIASLSFTTITVMLSHPLPMPAVSGAKQWSQICSQIFFSDTLPSLCLTKSTASWLVMTSHIPSHAKIRNSSSLCNLQDNISGNAVTACSFGSKSFLCLYSMSPIALLKLRLPFTLPSVTKPPALWILSDSSGSWGLWSLDMATALPFLEKTHLLSPAFATVTSSLITTATTAVHPADGPAELCLFSYPISVPVMLSTIVSTASSSTATSLPASPLFLFSPCLMPIRSCLI